MGREVDTSFGDKGPDECGYVNQHGLSRKVIFYLTFHVALILTFFLSQHIFESVKHSLERLQLSYIDVLQCKAKFLLLRQCSYNISTTGHRFDSETPIAETVCPF